MLREAQNDKRNTGKRGEKGNSEFGCFDVESAARCNVNEKRKEINL